MKTENKIVIFFKKLSDSAVGNWITEKLKLFFNYCINNAYWLFFMFIGLGLLTQPILVGATLSLYGLIALLVVILVLITGLFTGLDDSKNSRIRRSIVFIISSAYAVSMMTIYSYSPGSDEYVFNKKKAITPILYWNPLFKKMYPDITVRPKSITFDVITNQGDFQIPHSCVAYVDAATWEMFAVDEQKLTSFLRNDAKERLIASLSECRLDQVSNMSKTLYYSNGKFVRAKIE